MAARALLGLAVPGRLGVVSGRAGAVCLVRCGRRGGQALMHLLEPDVDGGLALQMLTVQPLDELMSWPLALEVRMVAVAEVELAAGGGVVADPPAAWFVAVVLLHQLVDARADRAENAELGKVRAESGPEPVIGSWLVDDALMHLEPVAHRPRVLKPDDQAGDDGDGRRDDADRTPLHCCSPPARCLPGLEPGEAPGSCMCRPRGRRPGCR